MHDDAPFTLREDISSVELNQLRKKAAQFDAVDRLRGDLHARLSAALARIEELEKLSVEHIMIDVTPGWDGMGEEIYAKSVDDVEKLLSRLSEKAEDFDLMTTPLQQKVAYLTRALQKIANLRAEHPKDPVITANLALVIADAALNNDHNL